MKLITSLLLVLSLVLGTTAYAQTSALDFDTDIDTEDLSESEREELIIQLQIIVLQLQAEIQRILQARASCPNLTINMSIGSRGDSVLQLQQFLTSLGSSIYPEGLQTSYYGNLTAAAVGRFQEQENVVSPGQPGYGVTGPLTRAAITSYCQSLQAQSTSSSDNDDSNDPGSSNSNSSSSSNPSSSSSSSSSNSSNEGSNSSSNSDDIFEVNTSLSASLTDSQIDFLEDSLNDPDASSIFLQYLNPTEIDENQPGTSNVESIVGTSPESKQLEFTDMATTTLSLGDSYDISWEENGFIGFDLISIEGHSGDIRYFFGLTVPELESYRITIPDDFAGKNSFELHLKHNGVIKDTTNINLN